MLSLYDASHFIPFQRCTVLSTLALQPDARLRFVGLQRIALYSPYGVMRHQLQPFQPPGLLAPERHLSCFDRSEEHTSELQSLMRISYAGFCLNKKRYFHTSTGSYRQNKHKQSTPVEHTPPLT